MAIMTAALMLTAVAGFLAGKEYDRSIKRINYNRRLRREKAQEEMKNARIQRQLETERKKNSFVYSVYYNAPDCKG